MNDYITADALCRLVFEISGQGVVACLAAAVRTSGNSSPTIVATVAKVSARLILRRWYCLLDFAWASAQSRVRGSTPSNTVCLPPRSSPLTSTRLHRLWFVRVLVERTEDATIVAGEYNQRVIAESWRSRAAITEPTLRSQFVNPVTVDTRSTAAFERFIRRHRVMHRHRCVYTRKMVYPSIVFRSRPQSFGSAPT